MKTKINHLFLFFLFALLSFTACQDEESDINNPDEQETIQSSSQLAELLSRTTANYGAMDDILDESSCFSVNLPVTIVVSGITIVIETEDDLENLEELFEDFDDNEDVLDFIFPITIIFSDYTEIVIQNEEQLDDFIEECEDEEDEVIECVDFVYPISFSVFNSDFNLVETVTIENDQALYEFLDDLEDDENALIVSLNYPVTLEYANGETLEVNSNEELAEAIEAAEDDCDDDYEENECDEEDIAELLVECPWNINDENEDFENYQFVFYEDGTLAITEGETTSAIGGAWSLTSTDNGLILNLFDLTAFQNDLGGEWLIVDCDDDELEIVRGDYEIELEQDCEDDLECSVADINEILPECAWELQTNLIDTTVQIYVYFTPNGQVLVDNNDGTENQIGTYDLMLVAGDIFIELTLEQPLNDLTGQWQIVECEDDELYLVKGDNYIELEQECDLYEGDDVFNCFGDFEIVECNQPNNVPVFNLSANTIGLVDCEYAFTPSFHTTIVDAENNTNAIQNTEAYGTLVAEVYLRIEAESGNFEIFTVYLNTEECNYFECFEDREIVVCDDDVEDGLTAFDLNAIYDCPEDNVVWTFHILYSDADASVGALVSPFVNTSNPQTIYARVEAAADPNIYEIFEVELIVEDCTEENCSEEDIDTILTECIWNAVNYNGSDNLMNWNFDFEENSQIVVIYTDTETIDATWTTSQSNDGVIVTFSNVAGPNIQAITGEWLVVECEEDRLELHRGDDILVLEQNCN